MFVSDLCLVNFMTHPLIYYVFSNGVLCVSASTVKEEDSKKVVKKKEVKTKVTLLDGKRAQNAGIALARIKANPEERSTPAALFEGVKKKVMRLDDTGFTTDQLKSLEVRFVFLCTVV